ncbi:hypothetical protein MMC12_004680 [Toensbergia leucococca]|nr:hypothetical protein [Toensbergia leucococca]
MGRSGASVQGDTDFHLYKSDQRELVGSSISLLLLSTIALALRLDWYVRAEYEIRSQPRANLITTQILSYGPCVANIYLAYSTFEGDGPIASLVSESSFHEILYIIQNFYFKRPLIIMGALVTAWWLASGVATILECIPIQAFWNTSVSGHCFNLQAFFIGTIVPSIVIDIIILIMPMPLIWNIHIERSQKLSMCGIFALGGFECVTAIVHLVYLVRTTQVNGSSYYVDAMVWTAVEPSIGVVSACLPSMRPLLSLLLKHLPDSIQKLPLRTTPNGTAISTKTYWPNRAAADRKEGSFSTLDSPLGSDMSWGNDATAYAQRMSQRSQSDDPLVAAEMGLPTDGIRVKKEFRWSKRTA